MSKNPKTKQKFNIDVIKTPEGHVPTVDSFHKVIDGLFGEVLDTRKDIAKLIPNLENELGNLREILAQQMVLFEIINDNIFKLEKEIKAQDKKITKIQKTTTDLSVGGQTEADLTEETKKALAKLVRRELQIGTKPIYDSLKMLENEISKSSAATLKKVEKQLDNIKDQIDDLSSKSELQMLEILESVNQEPIKRQTKSSATRTTKKRLTS
ncbi:MAG: hypothetical protein HZR80_01490 [Candidatus Heimdallarchaeota archaeon]